MAFGSKNKKNEEVSSSVENEVKVEEVKIEEVPEYTSKAFSMGRHEAGGFAVYTLVFNPITGEAKVSDILRTGESRSDVEYHLRIAIGNYMAEMESKS